MRSHTQISFALAALTALAGCAPDPVPPQSPVQTTMYRHFALARDMRSFAVSGELDRLREVALELSEAEEAWGLPPGSADHLDRVRRSARQASEAGTLAEAQGATADLAQACGDCHLANQVDLGSRFRTVAPLSNGSVARHMNRLAWVSRLLWDGLIGPSERTWSTGAGALVDTSAFPGPTATHVPSSVVQESARALAELAAEAVVTEPQGRPRLLERMWGVCTDCHAQAGIR